MLKYKASIKGENIVKNVALQKKQLSSTFLILTLVAVITSLFCLLIIYVKYFTYYQTTVNF